MPKYPVSLPKVQQIVWLLLAAGILGGCMFERGQSERADTVQQILESKPATTAEGGSTANTLEEYKRELGRRIVAVNSTKVYVVRPQALLRSVIVLRFVVDAQGVLVRSEIARTNRDKATETTALAALRNTAPFPKPPPALLTNGRLEISETWLFNNDGKFQLRSVAQPQMDR
jgi:protein TonB